MSKAQTPMNTSPPTLLAQPDLESERSHSPRLCPVSLQVLRRTAHSLATTPGGLRFVADSRPWLQGLAGGRPCRHRLASPSTALESRP